MNRTRRIRGKRKLVQVYFWIVLIVCIITGASLYALLFPQQVSIKQNTRDSLSEKVLPVKVAPIKSVDELIFVKYWNTSATNSPINIPSRSKSLLYFGVTADTNGLITTEPGYTGLASFKEKASQEEVDTFLTLRLFDENINTVLLDNSDIRGRIIDQTIEVAQSNGFAGVVLDFEHSVLATTETREKISQLYKNFYEKIHAQNLLFYTTIYGDTYYRGRPYDIKAMAEYSDRILIMAYDYHKSYGQPGPNFPISRKLSNQKYSYDFQMMIDDFLEDAPAGKLTVLFGMFGYEWIVDEQDRPLKPARARTTSQFETQYPTCSPPQCTRELSTGGGAPHIYFKNPDGYFTSIWFEDSSSVKEKVQILQSKGISSIGFW